MTYSDLVFLYQLNDDRRMEARSTIKYRANNVYALSLSFTDAPELVSLVSLVGSSCGSRIVFFKVRNSKLQSSAH